MTTRRLLLPALIASLLVLPASAGAVEPGTVIGPNTKVDGVAKTAEAGGKWVRLFYGWDALEPSRGNLDQPTVNALIGQARAYHAAGVKVLVVLTGAPGWANGGGPPPRPPVNAADFGSFAARISVEWRDWVDAYEVWNEPDGKTFWEGGPEPAKYAALLKAGYPGFKAGDPTAPVIAGGTVGANFDWYDELFKAGAGPFFDAAGVHTDIGCMAATPEFQYRDEKGRIGRYVFTGYREVRATMGDHNSLKPIWITEIGWPTPNSTCRFGGAPIPGKENDPGGVSEADQAEYLKRGLSCLHAEPFVQVATWFSLQDVDTSTNHENRFGLIRASGVEKPAFGAMAAWSKAPSAASACGEPVDRTPPAITSLTPAEGFQFANTLNIEATATDNLRVSKMELFVDGQKIGGQQAAGKFTLTPWFGAKSLALGKHTLVMKAHDGAMNVTAKTITVTKVDGASIAVPPAVFTSKVKKLSGRRINIRAKIGKPAGTTEVPRGKFRIFVSRKKGKKWVLTSKYTKGVKKPINFTFKIKKPGTYQIYTRYQATRPYKSQRSKPFTVRIR